MNVSTKAIRNAQKKYKTLCDRSEAVIRSKVNNIILGKVRKTEKFFKWRVLLVSLLLKIYLAPLGWGFLKSCQLIVFSCILACLSTVIIRFLFNYMYFNFSWTNGFHSKIFAMNFNAFKRTNQEILSLDTHNWRVFFVYWLFQNHWVNLGWFFFSRTTGHKKMKPMWRLP